MLFIPKTIYKLRFVLGVIESIGRCVGPELISDLVDQGRYVELRSGTSDHLYQELLKDRVDCIIATGQHFDAERSGARASLH